VKDVRDSPSHGAHLARQVGLRCRPPRVARVLWRRPATPPLFFSLARASLEMGG